MYTNIAGDVPIIYAGPGGLRHLSDPDITILHLHWDDRLFGRNPDQIAEAETRQNIIAQISTFQARGGQVIWTVHNRAPHKVTNLEGFQVGRKALCNIADTIHVHAPHAKDHLIEVYGTQPDKIHIVPHPSYLGEYEPEEITLNRDLPKADCRSFLFFGMFRGSKGIHKIRETAAKLTKRQAPFHLKMYGKAFASQARLLRLLEANPNVDLRTDRIPDKELAEIFGNAQVFLAPYDTLFTSGSVMLALTFGLPIIGPNIRELRETTPDACHSLFYDPASPRGLIRSMLQLTEMADATLLEIRQACLRFAQERSPDQASQDLRKILAINS